ADGVLQAQGGATGRIPVHCGSSTTVACFAGGGSCLLTTAWNPPTPPGKITKAIRLWPQITRSDAPYAGTHAEPLRHQKGRHSVHGGGLFDAVRFAGTVRPLRPLPHGL